MSVSIDYDKANARTQSPASVASAVAEGLSVVLPQHFGAVGDGVTDDTAALVAMRQYAAAHLPCVCYVPTGTYAYTDIGNWAMTGLTLMGAGSRQSKLKCTSSVDDHTALKFHAFESGSAQDPYIMQCNVRGLAVEGNAKTLTGILGYGLARCEWNDVRFLVGKASNGEAFRFNACHINEFSGLICSTDLDTMATRPYYGIIVDTGSRAGVNLGRSTNNFFRRPVMEGLGVGISLAQSDQGIFFGGTAESCSVYGMVVVSTSRNNGFHGVAFENASATADVVDSGESNQYFNCYSTKLVNIQGSRSLISGGLFQSITIDSGATKNRVQGVVIKYVSSGGAFTDNGTATEWKNIYDQQAAAFVYPLAARAAISVTASPFTYTNNLGQYVEIIIQSGTISQIRRLRDGVGFLAPTVVPGCHLLAPGDQIEVTYSSSAPSMSYLPHNGFQG